jgi:hypothetical protein
MGILDERFTAYYAEMTVDVANSSATFVSALIHFVRCYNTGIQGLLVNKFLSIECMVKNCVEAFQGQNFEYAILVINRQM